MITAEKHITLRELQMLVRQTLDERFALPLWVSAEISELKLNRSGHCYLELVEKGGDNGVPTAQARAVIWRNNYAHLSVHFAQATGSRLEAGLNVLAKVVVNYHEIYGFSLQIIDIDPSYTLGEMERQRRQTIARLQEEGVWEMNRSLDMPMPVQRVAVISGATAAGYGDFCNELAKSSYRFEVTLFEAYMQGAAAEESIVEALERVAERMDEFDVVAVIRGGGSVSDLNCFNAYRLCAHIAQFPLPVVTGIGHDKDVSVADMVAFRPLKTPTAVAGWLVDAAAEAEGSLEMLALRLRDVTRNRTHAEEMVLERLSGALQHCTAERLTRETTRREQLQLRLREVARNAVIRHGMRLAALEEVVAAHSPERLMKLGFAVLRTSRGAATSAAQLTVGESVEIAMHDGEILAKVIDTKIYGNK